MTETVPNAEEADRRPARSQRAERGRRKPTAAKVPAAALGQMSASASRSAPRTQSPIVPPRTVARRALLSLVAIMSFLSCLSVAAVAVVADRAESWQRQIAEEVTIQIKPEDGVDLDRSASRAAEIAMQVPGVVSATPLDENESAALLQPWLGSDLSVTDLPIPRLVAVRVAENADLVTLSRRLKEEIPLDRRR